jgi:hypothetical protein
VKTLIDHIWWLVGSLLTFLADVGLGFMLNFGQVRLAGS